MKYRSRTEIVGLILEVANGGGATKTKIMYKAFLSFAHLRDILQCYKTMDLSNTKAENKLIRNKEKGYEVIGSLREDV